MEVMAIKRNNYEILIPDYYQRLEPQPDDPKDAYICGVQTDHTLAIVKMLPIMPEDLVPRDRNELISGTRMYLNENQGIIEADTCDKYRYTIVKTILQPTHAMYTLLIQKFFDEEIIQIQGFFEEINETGIRDNMVFSMYRNQGIFGTKENPFDGWAHDPFDQSITEGQLMNFSELRDFDEKFPGWPLTMCREMLYCQID